MGIHSTDVEIGEVAELALASEARLRERSVVAVGAQECEVSERACGSGRSSGAIGGGGGRGRIGAFPVRHCGENMVLLLRLDWIGFFNGGR